MAYTVFISHCMKPEDIALLNPILRNAALLGVQCYMAQHDTQAGVNLDAKIKQQILVSDCVLALITQNSIKSDWVKWEVGVATASGKRVIPILQKGVQVPAFLAGKEYIEFDPNDPETTVRAVSDYLHKLKIADDKQKAIAWFVIGGVGLLAVLSKKDVE